MKISIIYYSYSGNTRGVAERVASACGGKLVEVRSKQYSSKLTAYTVGFYRAMKGMSDPIDPERIDVSCDDLIVIGTPVWAGRAAPAINAAVAALQGCDGKKAVIFATCGSSERETLPILKKTLGARGMTVAREFVFDRNSIKDADRLNALTGAIKTAGGFL